MYYCGESPLEISLKLLVHILLMLSPLLEWRNINEKMHRKYLLELVHKRRKSSQFSYQNNKILYLDQMLTDQAHLDSLISDDPVVLVLCRVVP